MLIVGRSIKLILKSIRKILNIHYNTLESLPGISGPGIALLMFIFILYF